MTKKKKITNKERIRRIIQSQRAIQGYAGGELLPRQEGPDERERVHAAASAGLYHHRKEREILRPDCHAGAWH